MAWYIFYALTLITSFVIQIILIFLQSRANAQAPHRSLKYLLTGSYIALLSIPIPYAPMFLIALRPYAFPMQIAGWIIFVIGAIYGVIGTKLLFDRYVELVKSNSTHA